ncbi:MAG: hypothetical protein JXB13_06220 [Phycisphaerae bacterium]|nr:hypothetical protein [Phycisphaerae bacterium]
MTWRIHNRSLALGAVLGAGLCLLIGAAAREELPGPVGRYDIDCTQNGAYLVDTVTGQVWHNSEREFRLPKIGSGLATEAPAPVRTPTARTPTARTPAGFVGKWVLNHPTEGQLSIQIAPDGRAVLTEGDNSWDGKWRIEGNRITITTERESVTAELDSQGGLLVREGSGEAIPFRRAP